MKSQTKKAIIARKIGMSQIFDDKGAVIPVTVLEAGPCVVTQIKTTDTDGYDAVQLAFGDVKPKHVNKPSQGRYKKHNITPKKYLKEFRLTADLNVGDSVEANTFSNGDKVDVSATSKGKGYQGAIKRHGQHRGPMTHGSKYHRGLGAMSGATDPGKVKKGKHMPGHMGHVMITTQNLTVAKVIHERNLLLIKGAVPGPRGAIVAVKETVKVDKRKKTEPSDK